MAKGGTGGSAPQLEADKYLQSLMSQFNGTVDSLHKAAAWYLGFVLVLTVIAVSTKDAALLMAQGTSLPQINLSIPVTLTFALGPYLFLIAYIYVASRLRVAEQLRSDVEAEFANLGLDPPTKAKLSRLLTDTPFIRQGDETDARQRLGGLLGDLVKGPLPLIVLMILEISGIRLQNLALTLAQQLAVVLLVAALLWRSFQRYTGRRTAWLRRRAAPAVVGVVLVFLWASIPSPDDWALLTSRAYDTGTDEGDPVALCNAAKWSTCVGWVVADPLDMAVCPTIGWGCRYMRLYWLKLGAAPDPDGVHAISGIDLHERSLRFADLDGADFSEADLSSADLRGAFLRSANLASADLDKTRLECSHLHAADLGCQEDGGDGGDNALKAELCRTLATHVTGTVQWACRIKGEPPTAAVVMTAGKVIPR